MRRKKINARDGAAWGLKNVTIKPRADIHLCTMLNPYELRLCKEMLLTKVMQKLT